jgi:hypothetical protein
VAMGTRDRLCGRISGAGCDPVEPKRRTGRACRQVWWSKKCAHPATNSPEVNVLREMGKFKPVILGELHAAGAGIKTQVGNHTFRATGITAYLKTGGSLENAAAMANHASTRS